MPVPKILTTSCVEIQVQASMDGGFNSGGDCVLNVLHFIPAPNTPPQPEIDTPLSSWLTAWQEIWRANILPLVTTAYKVERYFARELSGTRLVKPTDPNSKVTYVVRQIAERLGSDTADRGTQEGAWLPNFAAVSIYKNTLLDGRNGKGFTRFAGILEADTQAAAGNALTADAKNAWQGASDILKDPFGTPDVAGETLTPVLLQKTKLFADGPGVIDLTPYMKSFNYVACQSYITSQVSRKRKQMGCK